MFSRPIVPRGLRNGGRLANPEAASPAESRLRVALTGRGRIRVSEGHASLRVLLGFLLPSPVLSSAMAPKGGSKQQSEEDLLLQDFSRNLSAKSSALFFGNAFIVSAIPICELRAGGGGDVAGAVGEAGVRVPGKSVVACV